MSPDHWTKTVNLVVPELYKTDPNEDYSWYRTIQSIMSDPNPGECNAPLDIIRDYNEESAHMWKFDEMVGPGIEQHSEPDVPDNTGSSTGSSHSSSGNASTARLVDALQPDINPITIPPIPPIPQVLGRMRGGSTDQSM